MPGHFMTRARTRLLLVLMTLSCAAAAAAQAATGVRYGVAPELDCEQAGKAAARGRWLEASGVAVEGSPARRMSLSFDEAVATDTIQAAMNGMGARDLALVEVQDGNGGWHKAWEGRMPAPGVEQTCFEQQLPTKQVVQALRFTFRAAEDQVEVNHAALLRR